MIQICGTAMFINGKLWTGDKKLFNGLSKALERIYYNRRVIIFLRKETLRYFQNFYDMMFSFAMFASIQPGYKKNRHISV
ncbi:MAG: hypothetical protein IPP29_06185 [Bacteroidetes bacterium]|nr:hypothetical protein [Bacteroidota bacterium]